MYKSGGKPRVYYRIYNKEEGLYLNIKCRLVSECRFLL